MKPFLFFGLGELLVSGSVAVGDFFESFFFIYRLFDLPGYSGNIVYLYIPPGSFNSKSP